MENNKHMKKIIIAIFLVIAFVTLIIAFLYLNKDNNFQDTSISKDSKIDNENYSNNISNNSFSSVDNNVLNNSTTNSNITNSTITNTTNSIIDNTIEFGGKITENSKVKSKENNSDNENVGFSNDNNENDVLNVDNYEIEENEFYGDGYSLRNSNNNESGYYANDTEIEESAEIGIIIHKPDYTEESEEDVLEEKKSNYKENDISVLSIKDNDYSKLKLKLNLLNAPYNNNEYCENKLDYNYNIKLVSKPQGSTCTNYPEKIVMQNEGKLYESKHKYTKTGDLDFSNTKFNALGDYCFEVTSEETGESIYQIIISFRNVTDSNDYPTGKVYSLIQLKSLLDGGKKVDDMNIDILNPNTSITVDKILNPNSFLEKVYLDIYIDSYKDDVYTVLDATKEDENQLNTKIGDFLVIRDENGNIIPQICKLLRGGKIIIGKKEDFLTGVVAQLATLGELSDLNLSEEDLEKIQSVFEIPAGTKYKVSFSSGKKYKEEYSFEVGGGEFVEANPNPDDNLVVLVNLTEKNPKTGIFYNIIPFVTVIGIAIIGIIIIIKSSYKDDDK